MSRTTTTTRRPVRRPVLIVVSAAVLLLGLLAGCGSGGGAQATGQGLRVVLDWTPNTNHTGIYVAKEKGWYHDAGLDVSVVQPGQDSTSIQQLAAGKADVVVSTQEEVIAARAQGIPVVSVAAILQHNTSSLVALKKSGIASITDLGGHTYGGYGGPLEESLVKKLTACGGGDPSTVKIVQAGDADYRIGMQRGDYDFVWIFDGWDGIRYKDIDKLDVTSIPFIDHTDCIPDWYTPVLATSEKLAAQHPDELARFMHATYRGYRFAISDPKASASILDEAVPELDPKLVALSADFLSTRYADDPARWGHQDLDIWNGMGRLRPGVGDDQAADRPRGRLHQQVPAGRRPLRHPAMARCAVTVTDLRHRFDGREVLAGIDLAVAEGQFVSLLGPSGCGKSTLLKVLAGLLVPGGGGATIQQEPVIGRTGHVAYMPQKDLLLPWRRALANATLGAEVDGVAVPEARRRAAPLFERFGLAGFERAYPGELSGGMRQRLALLRTFLISRDVVLLDEPFGALDAITRRQMYEWLSEVWQADRRTVLFVTHDIDEAVFLSDRVVVLSGRPGRVVADLAIGLPRPRGADVVTDPAFLAHRADLLAALAT